ncbi:MAG TPA: hypothetical protein VH187_22375 [Scandinavium sp.]|uniref:hypothetical protein n=1 Tax=Scandinavium sp. TaxID=2830653 RepID=UPI002E3345D6|nr:hypothetical protein [Scandinavium sp.]HEX4503882.1 hypothetical protein [Scandinavium sp.]
MTATTQAPWTMAVGPWNTGPVVAVANARGRQFNFQVDDSSKFTFTLNGNDTVFQYITELVTDVWVYRYGQLFWRGRIGATSDAIDEQSNVVTLNCFDYREWLGRQILGPGATLSWRAQTSAKVINDMLVWILGRPGLQPQLTLDASGLPTSTINFDTLVGGTVKDVVASMNGFGWQVIPVSQLGLNLKAVSPFYYRRNDVFVMEYGGAVAQVARSLDTGNFADSVFASGDMALAPIVQDATGIATAPQGRIMAAASDPSIVDHSHLVAFANQQATNMQLVAAAWTCVLKKGVWINQADAWVGDIIKFIVKSGRININDNYRITQMDLTLSDDGADHQVNLTLVKPPFMPY